jgi:hypothetical protein
MGALRKNFEAPSQRSDAPTVSNEPEGKTKLAESCEQVARGPQPVIIMRRGRPVRMHNNFTR